MIQTVEAVVNTDGRVQLLGEVRVNGPRRALVTVLEEPAAVPGEVGPLAAGEVVLVPFPFSDLSLSKVRAAVCLADAGRGDWVMCQITSSPYGDPAAIPLDAPDFASGGLLVASHARPGKLFTAHRAIVVRAVGRLNVATFQRVLDGVVTLLRPPAKP